MSTKKSKYEIISDFIQEYERSAEKVAAIEIEKGIDPLHKYALQHGYILGKMWGILASLDLTEDQAEILANSFNE